VNCSVTLASTAEDPREVLRGYEQWPTWMWANEEVYRGPWLHAPGQC
jgi:erythromycin esterase